MEVVMVGSVRVHKDLVAWQVSILLAELVYRVSRTFPAEERFGLTSQMRRAAVSISSNIAEGAARATSREFAHHLSIARASWAELDTQAILAERLGFVAGSNELFVQIGRMGQLLNALYISIRRSQARSGV
jgi:four helix bundle protein